MPELPTRPPLRRARAHGGATAVRAVRERVIEWCRWVGLGRLAAGSLVVIAVVVGGYWLLRPPALPVEHDLPFSTTTATTATTVVPPADRASGTSIVVHVAGAVIRPGVYSVDGGSRVIDAITAAGGLAVDAAPDAINLAAFVADAERIYVPRIGETPPAPSPSADEADAAGPINLNNADAATLETLPGIGPTTAAAIIAYRDTHGPFATVDELGEVTGIGPAKLDAIRDLVTV